MGRCHAVPGAAGPMVKSPGAQKGVLNPLAWEPEGVGNSKTTLKTHLAYIS